MSKNNQYPRLASRKQLEQMNDKKDTPKQEQIVELTELEQLQQQMDSIREDTLKTINERYQQEQLDAPVYFIPAGMDSVQIIEDMKQLMQDNFGLTASVEYQDKMIQFLLGKVKGLINEKEMLEQDLTDGKGNYELLEYECRIKRLEIGHLKDRIAGMEEDLKSEEQKDWEAM